MATEQAPASNAIADPAPLGLAGFALTTVLLSAVNAGKIATGGEVFVGMALFYGGLGQFMAGMWEFKRNNTFGATAFSSFGAFWMGVGILFVIDHFAATPMLGADGLTWFFLCWAVFTSYMFVASLRVSGAVALVFLLLALTFWALWIGAGHRDAAGHGWTALGGWLGIITAIVAFYTSFAGVVNTTFGRTVLPTYPLTIPLLAQR
ncbi:MAG TPA: acetate uptake transporter [Chloroflexota bacterium]|nr:acetate uptake transporter [Chloroflexota bacterium]